jgi:hypothetical protein
VNAAPLLQPAEVPPVPGSQAVDGRPFQGAVVSSRVLNLADALGEQLGSEDLPTEGSRGHKDGTCKPCAFLHKRGCENGVRCQFCHLCELGEKKRRQKDKKAHMLAMRQMGLL